MEPQLKSSAMGDAATGSRRTDTVKRARRIVFQYRVIPMDVTFDEGTFSLSVNINLGFYNQDEC